MGLFQTINLEACNRELEFLVIGGLAVNFHGYSRDSADLDLLIRREAREQWLALFAELDYSVDKEKDAFIQLSPPKGGAWPVDLMATVKCLVTSSKVVSPTMPFCTVTPGAPPAVT